MIDFDKATFTPANFGGSEKKTSRMLDGKRYMIKMPDPAKKPRNPHSYKNNQFSEHIGCLIFKSCGINTQETVLGTMTDPKGSLKTVVACQDFTQDGSILSDFKFLGHLADSERQMKTSIEDVYLMIDYVTSIWAGLKKEELKKSFWDMFVIDALIGNTDRHLGNWGLLSKDGNVAFSPIYDCGSSLCAWLNEEMMEDLLKNSGAFNNEEYNVKSVYSLNGKRIFYQEIFQNPPYELQSALNRLYPKINIEKIHQIIDETEGMSATHKTYMKKAIDLRFRKILTPAFRRLNA